MAKLPSRIDLIADEILSAFEAGSVPRALANIFLFRHLDLPCHRWSWGNQFIAALYRHVDARGFRQWQEAGRFVKKGERAFYILGPVTYKAAEDIPDKGIAKGDPVLCGFRDIPVFGYDQTQGDPLPYIVDAESRLPELPLRQVAHAWGIEVEAAPLHLRQLLGRYTVVPDEQGPTSHIQLAVANPSVWLHELVHAADDRLGELRRTSKVSREVVAELGATILLEALGRPDESDRGGAYRYITREAQKEDRTAFDLASELVERTCRCVELILSSADSLAADVAA